MRDALVQTDRLSLLPLIRLASLGTFPPQGEGVGADLVKSQFDVL